MTNCTDISSVLYYKVLFKICVWWHLKNANSYYEFHIQTTEIFANRFSFWQIHSKMKSIMNNKTWNDSLFSVFKTNSGQTFWFCFCFFFFTIHFKLVYIMQNNLSALTAIAVDDSMFSLCFYLTDFTLLVPINIY